MTYHSQNRTSRSWLHATRWQRKFAGMMLIVNRRSATRMFSSRIAFLLSFEDDSSESKGERAPATRTLLSAAPLGHDTREDLRFHHYAMEDDRYHPPRGSSASTASSLPGWPGQSIGTEQMSCESRRTFSSSCYVPPSLRHFTRSTCAMLGENQIGNIRPSVINDVFLDRYCARS